MSMEAQEKTLRKAAEFSGFTSVEILLEEGRSPANQLAADLSFERRLAD
jgi:hypothetical protein